MEEEKERYIVNGEKKGNKVLNIICNYAFWFLIVIYLEIAYRISMQFDINLESYINITLYGLIVGAFLGIITRILKNKNFITAIILFVLGLLFCVQCVFTKIFKTNFAISNLALGDQAAGFMGDAIERYIQ